MPIHDWTRVAAGIFHDFHHEWITEIKRALNAGLSPEEYYALSDQFASGFGPNVLTLQGSGDNGESKKSPPIPSNGGTGVLLAPPKVELTGETEMEFYRRKPKVITVRHVSGDRVVAMVEIVSPNNKASRNPFLSFVEKAAELLNHRIHLLIIDLFPPTPRDPQGIHAAIWEDLTAEEYTLPRDKPLTLASYETALTIRAYVEHLAVGDTLTDRPLFLEPEAHIEVPLERTYQIAFADVPRRWRQVLAEPPE